MGGVYTLGISDGEVNAADPAQRDLVLDLIRSTRPQVILTHWPHDYMADHNEASKLLLDASHIATLPLKKTGHPAHELVPAVYYIDTLAASPEALHASFAIYRALDATIAQNQQRMTRRLQFPVLGIGGAKSLGEQVAATMKLAADDVQTLVVPGCAHWVPEETPDETIAALTAFLAPYRDEQAATHPDGPRATPV